MSKSRRQLLSCFLCAALLLPQFGCGGAKREVQAPKQPLAPAVFEPLQEALQKPYMELFETAAGLEFSQKQIEDMRQYLTRAEDFCQAKFQQRARTYDQQVEQAQLELRKVTARINEQERHQRHCSIQNLRAVKSQAEVLADKGIPVAYDNKLAKLELIEKWPAEHKQIEQNISSGAYKQRPFADAEDVGFRKIFPDQEKDVDDGKRAVEEMRRSGLMPPEIESKLVRDYVNTLAQRIAKNSDLRVPLNVFIPDSKEVNAFALPGGYLFVQRGLLEEVEDESQLAGVLAHEIAHSAARHSARMRTRATIAQLVFQAAQIAAVILTGGAAGVGAYYALQYGFYGLGLILDLSLLGVSRDFELEADQLGVQYSWKSGYDPTGFIRFFDKMATKEGYVNGLSWFRTHPPFYERMVRSMTEVLYLPKRGEPIVTSAEFQKMKEEVERIKAEAEAEERERPSLRAAEPGCPPPEKLEYEPGEPVEKICPVTEIPQQRTAAAR